MAVPDSQRTLSFRNSRCSAVALFPFVSNGHRMPTARELAAENSYQVVGGSNRSADFGTSMLLAFGPSLLCRSSCSNELDITPMPCPIETPLKHAGRLLACTFHKCRCEVTTSGLNCFLPCTQHSRRASFESCQHDETSQAM